MGNPAPRRNPTDPREPVAGASARDCYNGYDKAYLVLTETSARTLIDALK